MNAAQRLREIADELSLNVLNSEVPWRFGLLHAAELRQIADEWEQHGKLNTDLIAENTEVMAERDSLAARVRHLEGASSTYGELFQIAPFLAERIEPHEWDNRGPCNQRDWVMTESQAEVERLKAELAEAQRNPAT